MGHLDGKIALVTGASAGIGEQTARTLADAGAQVICAARRLPHLESLAAELGDAAIALELDVTDEESVAKLLDRLPLDWRDIDILVNNAGHDIGGRRQFHEGTAAQWAATIETNVIGLMRVTRTVLDSMVERNTGHIVNIGSVAGIQAPTRPDASSFPAVWNVLTALVVAGPNSPSIESRGEGSSRALSVRCRASTSGPLAPASRVTG